MRKKLVNWIKNQVKQAGAKGIVLGLSGGLDSSVVAALAKEAIGRNKVLALILPCKSQSQDLKDARLIAKKLNIKTKTINLGNINDNLIKILPKAKGLALANLRPRLRMLVLYYFANKMNYLVCGTGNKSEIMAGYFCYDENTRTLTKEGLKTYKELKQGDVVFSLESNTGHVIENPIAEKFVFDYNGKIMSYGGRKSEIDLMVTPNHRMLLDKGGFQFCRVDRLPRRSTPMPIPRPWEGIQEPPSVFEFDNERAGWDARYFSSMPTEDFLYILGLYIGDGHAQLSSVGQFVKETGFGAWQRDSKTGRFINKEIPATLKKYASYRTWFALPKGSSAHSKLIAVLKKNNIIYGKTPTQVWVYGKAFCQAMKKCGSSAHAKCIPSEILNYPARYLEILLNGLMDSDGTPRGIYYTVSKKLAEQIVELGCKLGRNITLRKRPARVSIRKDGVKINGSECYEVSIYGNGRHWLNGAKFKRIDYRGKVWCPDIPGSHNLLVERNGRFIFCGNTKHGDGATDILPIGDLTKTQVRRLAKELGIAGPIITKAPAAGLWPGQTDEGEMGITYPELDDIIERLEHKKKQVLSGKKVEKVKNMVRRSEHKRQGPRICYI
ncbi:MAG: NAD(+) synthase [Candidatus Omnitrophica bacterium]|nr:NAD(+) synthase [Candidatus Omnitrophota bacterium]